MILIILTYLAGVLTILSPCILPVLPFVFSRSQQPFVKSALPLLLGMIVTFSLFSALAVVGGAWISQANEVGRIFAMGLFSLFGLSLLFPHVSEKLLSPLTQMGSKIGMGQDRSGFGGSFLLGISTGLLWAPCAGPILGLVLTGVASQHDTAKSIGLLVSYSLGAATSLSLALAAGNKFLGTLKKFLGVDVIVKKGLGIAVLLGVAAIALNLDRTFLTHLSKFETASLENSLLTMAGFRQKEEIQSSVLSDEGEMPEIPKGMTWLNSKPFSRRDLRGKVVLVDFWTYSCINCLRTLPYIKGWADKYKNNDFIIIGVHTPEFAFEKSLANVQDAVKSLGISYPVVLDSDYKIWNLFNNQYWPAHYFIDRQGHIRHHHFGEGGYDEAEKIIRNLLSENGASVVVGDSSAKAEGVEAEASGLNKSPETYIGSKRAKNFVSKLSGDLQMNQWSLEGKWQISEEKAISGGPGAKIIFRFHARDLHLVLGAAKKIKFKVKIDGRSPGEDHGTDIDKDGNGQVESQRLYQLLRLKNDNSNLDHIFEIEFFDSGVEAYAFTFG